MKRTASVLGALSLLAACAGEPAEEVGYLSIAAPAGFLPLAEAPVLPEKWTVFIAAEDMKPVVKNIGARTEVIPVKAGRGRFVHVFGGGAPVGGVSYGYAGSVTVDVRPQGETPTDIIVHPGFRVEDGDDSIAAFPTGDTAPGGPDIAALSVERLDDALRFVVMFRNAPAAPWSTADNRLLGLVELDLDADVATGSASLVEGVRAATTATTSTDSLGVDARIDFRPVRRNVIRFLRSDDGVTRELAARFAGSALIFTVPDAYLEGLLGEKETAGIRLAAMASSRRGANDFLPDSGFISAEPNLKARPITLNPVSAFQGAPLASAVDIPESSLPVIRSGRSGLHLGWTTRAGFTYLRSTDGRLIDGRFDGKWSASELTAGKQMVPTYLDMVLNDKGAPTIAIAGEDYSCSTPCYLYTTVAQYADGAMQPPVAIAQASLWPYTTPSLVANGSKVYLLPRAGLSDMTLWQISGGRGTELGALDMSTLEPMGATLMPSPSGGLALVASGLGTLHSSNIGLSGGTVSQSVPVELPNFTATGNPQGPIRAAATRSKPVVALPAAYFIAVHVGGATHEVSVPNVYVGEGAQRVDVAVSPSGRVALVFSGYNEVEGTVGVYYAEKLPGDSSFNQALRLHESSTEGSRELAASVAFDRAERPIALVADSTCTWDIMERQSCTARLSLHYGR